MCVCVCVCVCVFVVREKSVDRTDSEFIHVSTRIVYMCIRKQRFSIDSIVVRYPVSAGE